MGNTPVFGVRSVKPRTFTGRQRHYFPQNWNYRFDRMSAAGTDSPLHNFLSGGGEMGARMREFDWSRSPLGPLDSWPQSLRTSVSTCLNSRFAILVWWGRDFVKLYNDSYAVILGKKHPAALGASGRAVWPEIWHIIGPMLQAVMDRGEATWSDNLLLELERDGYPEECYFTFSYSPIRDESGGVGGIFTPVQETTQAVIGERRLRTLRDLAGAARGANAQNVHEVCQVAAWVLAKNPHDIPFAALYLLSPEPVLAASAGFESTVLPLPELFPEAFQPPTPQALSIPPGLAGLPRGAWPVPPREAVALPILLPGQPGPFGVLILGVSPRKRLDDDYMSFLSLIGGHVTTAIAETRAFEEERRRATALAELDRAKTAFFSNVSHEFRTPLTLMLGPLKEMLAMGAALPESARDLASMAHRNGLRLQKLVNTLLDFSRIEAGRVQAKFEPADLATLTADLASTFRSAIEKAGLRYTVDCRPLPEPVYVDRGMWEKIVLNLISNAFKYTFEGEIQVRLEADPGAPGKVSLTVSDTGVGIPEAEQPRLFERFRRVEAPRARTQEGTGIGLALVSELVSLHGGSVAVSSAPGQGSAFTVSLPLGSAHLPAESLTHTPSDGLGEAAADSWVEEAAGWLPQRADIPPEPGASGRVVVVDDNADMRGYIARLLSPHYRVETLTNGRDALEAILKQTPDLVLSDVMMPELDGFGLLDALRSRPETRALPVVLLSARAGEEARAEGLVAGATDYLVKPFTARDLIACVGSHMQMARARREMSEREAELRREAEAARDEAVAVLESITDGFLAVDGDWRLSYINPEGEALVGSSAAECLGRNLWELFPGLRGSIAEREYRRAFYDRVPVDFENLYEPWQRWFAVRAYPGRPAGISVYFRDVTEQKRAEAALRESEQRFRTMADNIPNLAWMADPDGYIFWYNQRWYEYTGCTPEQMMGWEWRRVHDPELLPLVMERWSASLASGEPMNMEFPLRSAQGTFEWFLTRVRPVRDDAGQIVRWFGTNTNIDAERKVREALKTSEQLARSVIDGSPDGVEVLDAAESGGRAVLVNRRARQLRDLNNAEPEVSWIESWRRDQRPAAMRALSQALNGATARFDAAFADATHEPKWLEVSLTPLTGEGGAVTRVLCITRDTTAARRAEEKLRQTARLESLGVMAGGIAHDFNNLLTGILGNASLLRETAAEEDRPLADDIVLAAERAADLTRQMLAFSGKGRFQICRTDLCALTAEIVRLVRPSIERNVDIRLDLGENCFIEGDPGQLQQVIMNLAINAGEAMEGREGAIVIRTRRLHAERGWLTSYFTAPEAEPGSYVLLEVSDNGKGMDEETKSRIFDPFFTTKFTGRGLGLAAVSGIVRGHNGLLRVHSVPGEGTSFLILFPSLGRDRPVEGPAPDVAAQDRGTILLVDDEEIIRRIGAEVLRRHGYTVRVAANGAEAVRTVREHPGEFDAIVLDMLMPLMNGEEALRAIRELDAEVPVIVCSGYNEVEVFRRFTAQKVGSFLQKPYTAARLLEKVRQELKLVGPAGLEPATNGL